MTDTKFTPKFIPIQYNQLDAVKRKHVAFFTKEDQLERKITLCEVVIFYYPHPEAPLEALIEVMDVIDIVTKGIGLDSGTLQMFEHAENMMCEYIRNNELNTFPVKEF